LIRRRAAGEVEQFLLQENIRLFRQRLTEPHEPRTLATIRMLLAAAERQLAMLEAERRGATLIPTIVGTSGKFQTRDRLAELRKIFEADRRPHLIVDPRPGLHIVDINDAYAGATMTSRLSIAGQRLFDVFPDNPDDVAADGVSNLMKSLHIAADSGRPHAMEVQRYDVRDASGSFVEKYWQPVNTPILDDNGNLVFILHHVEDVTDDVLAAPMRSTGPK
jgi:PAS domain-containing protein